jgi:serine/threonine-protein kinase
VTANPFTFGNPIRDPARFVGRRAEIRQIVSRLTSSAHESTSVVGERRMGKTSLLNYLVHPEVAPVLGLAPQEYCLVYLDFQGLTDITPRRFWQRVLGKMARAASDPDLAGRMQALAAQADFDLFDLEDLFDAVGACQVTTVLLLDEFEYVTQNPNFGSDFFGGLRALAIHHCLALVPATRRELVDLCHSAEIKGSPFFNIFANVVLRPMPRPDVNDLWRGYVADSGWDLTPEDKEFALQLGGGHPFFVQMAGYYLIEAVVRGLSGQPLRAFVAAQFDQQADAHHVYLWTHCSESERVTLLAAFGLSRQKPSRKTAPSLDNLARLHSRAALDVISLGKRGLLSEADGMFALFSSSFERWVALEILAPEGQQESEASVEAFLAEGGRERLEPVRGSLPRFKRKYWPVVGDILKEVSFELIAGALISRMV